MSGFLNAYAAAFAEINKQTITNVQKGALLQKAYDDTMKKYPIQDVMYSILSSGTYTQMNQQSIHAVLTKYDFTLFTDIEESIKGVRLALETKGNPRRAKLVNSLSIYNDVLQSFEHTFASFHNKDDDTIRDVQRTITPSDEILMASQADPQAQSVKKGVLQILDNIEGDGWQLGGGNAQVGGSYMLTANDIADFIRVCESAAMYVNRKILALNPYLLLNSLLMNYAEATSEVERINLFQQITRERTLRGLTGTTPETLAAEIKPHIVVDTTFLQNLRDALKDDEETDDTLDAFLSEWNGHIPVDVNGQMYAFLDKFLRPFQFMSSANKIAFDLTNSPYGTLGNPYPIQDSLYEYMVDTLGKPVKDTYGNFTVSGYSEYVSAHIVLILAFIYGQQTGSVVLMPLFESMGVATRFRFTTWLQIQNFIINLCFNVPRNSVVFSTGVKALMGGGRRKTYRRGGRRSVKRGRKTRRHH
jgi:hypothetical protein